MNRQEAKNVRAGTPFPDDPLFSATSNDDIAEIKRLLITGKGDINCVTWAYGKGLPCFVQSHDALDVILENGLIVDERTLINFIQHKITRSYPETDFECEVLEKLIKWGAPIDGSSEAAQIKEFYEYQANRLAPIVKCFFESNLRFMEILLRNGANPSIEDLGSTTRFTPLHWNVMHWHHWHPVHKEDDDTDSMRTCDLLIEYGADPYRFDIDGNTPIHLAAKYCLIRPFEYLAQHGVSLLQLNGEGRSILYLAGNRHREANALHGSTSADFKKSYNKTFSCFYTTDLDTGEIVRK